MCVCSCACVYACVCVCVCVRAFVCVCRAIISEKERTQKGTNYVAMHVWTSYRVKTIISYSS